MLQQLMQASLNKSPELAAKQRRLLQILGGGTGTQQAGTVDMALMPAAIHWARANPTEPAPLASPDSFLLPPRRGCP
jgi:hypothetical protein